MAEREEKALLAYLFVQPFDKSLDDLSEGEALLEMKFSSLEVKTLLRQSDLIISEAIPADLTREIE